MGTGTLLVLAPLLLVAGFVLGRWSVPAGAAVAPEGGAAPQRVAVAGPAPAVVVAAMSATVTTTAKATPPIAATTALPVQSQRPGSGPQELVPLPGGPGQGPGPGQGQTPGQGTTPAPGQGQAQGQSDCMLFMFRDGRLFQFGGPGMPGTPGAPGTQPSPFGFGGPGTGPGTGPGGPQELYPLHPAPSPGLPAPNVPPRVPSAPMPPPSMSRTPVAPPNATPTSAATTSAAPVDEATTHPTEGRS